MSQSEIRQTIQGKNNQGLPREGFVSEVRREWTVHSDTALAHRLQSEEYNHHLGHNRQNNAILRHDFPTAQQEQVKADYEAAKDQNEWENALARQEERDTALAAAVARRLDIEEEDVKARQEIKDFELARKIAQKEKKRILQKKERRQVDREAAYLGINSGNDNVSLLAQNDKRDRVGRKGGRNKVEGSPGAAGLSEENIYDLSDFCVKPPPNLDEDELKDLQEQQDQELALLLQEQDVKRRGDLIGREKLSEIEAQDEELAKILQEQEKSKAKKAREKARQKALLREKESNRSKTPDNVQTAIIQHNLPHRQPRIDLNISADSYTSTSPEREESHYATLSFSHTPERATSPTPTLPVRRRLETHYASSSVVKMSPEAALNLNDVVHRNGGIDRNTDDLKYNAEGIGESSREGNYRNKGGIDQNGRVAITENIRASNRSSGLENRNDFSNNNTDDSFILNYRMLGHSTDDLNQVGKNISPSSNYIRNNGPMNRNGFLNQNNHAFNQINREAYDILTQNRSAFIQNDNVIENRDAFNQNNVLTQNNNAFNQNNNVLAQNRDVFNQSNIVLAQNGDEFNQINNVLTQNNNAYQQFNSALAQNRNVFNQSNSALTQNRGAFNQSNNVLAQGNVTVNRSNNLLNRISDALTKNRSMFNKYGNGNLGSINEDAEITENVDIRRSRDALNGSFEAYNEPYHGGNDEALNGSNDSDNRSNGSFNRSLEAVNGVNAAYFNRSGDAMHQGNEVLNISGPLNRSRDSVNRSTDALNRSNDRLNRSFEGYNEPSICRSNDALNRDSDASNRSGEAFARNTDVFNASNEAFDRSRELCNIKEAFNRSNDGSNRTIDVSYDSSNEALNRSCEVLNINNKEFNKTNEAFNRSGEASSALLSTPTRDLQVNNSRSSSRQSMVDPRILNPSITSTPTFNIACAIDPTYHRRVMEGKLPSPTHSLEHQTRVSPMTASQNISIPNATPKHLVYHEDGLNDDDYSPPPYMPIQGQRRTSSLEKSKNKKSKNADKSSCKQQ